MVRGRDILYPATGELSEARNARIRTSFPLLSAPLTSFSRKEMTLTGSNLQVGCPVLSGKKKTMKTEASPSPARPRPIRNEMIIALLLWISDLLAFKTFRFPLVAVHATLRDGVCSCGCLFRVPCHCSVVVPSWFGFRALLSFESSDFAASLVRSFV